MGLYLRARQIIKTKSITYDLLNNGHEPEIRHTVEPLPRVQREDLLKQLSVPISEYASSNKDFCIIVLFLGKVIDRAESTFQPQKKEITLEVISSIALKMLTDISQLIRIFSQNILIVIPYRTIIDPELFVHQFFYALKRNYTLQADFSSAIFEGRIRYFPHDGDDIVGLLEELI